MLHAHSNSPTRIQVPVTVKTTYTCDKVETASNTAIIRVEGVLNTAESNLVITYGPQ